MSSNKFANKLEKNNFSKDVVNFFRSADKLKCKKVSKKKKSHKPDLESISFPKVPTKPTVFPNIPKPTPVPNSTNFPNPATVLNPPIPPAPQVQQTIARPTFRNAVIPRAHIVPVQKAPVPVKKLPFQVQKAPVPVQKAPVPVQKAPVQVTQVTDDSDDSSDDSDSDDDEKLKISNSDSDDSSDSDSDDDRKLKMLQDDSSDESDDEELKAVKLKATLKSSGGKFNPYFGTLESSFTLTDVTNILTNKNGDSGSLFNVVKTGLAIQDDNKILVACSYKNGSVSNSNTRSLAVIRYGYDGSFIDTSFGKNGIFSYSANGAGSTPLGDICPTSITIQNDRKILISGFIVSKYVNPYSIPNAVLFRLNIDGTLDNTFGAGTGIVTLNLADAASSTNPAYTRFSMFSSVMIQKSGNIVAVGTCGTAGSGSPVYYMDPGNYNPRSVLAARFLPDGTLDSTFGTNGIYEGTYSNSIYVSFSGIGGGGLTSTDGIYIGGYAADGNNDMTGMDTLFVKLTKDGVLDTSFNSSATLGAVSVAGIVVYPIPNGQSLNGGTPSEDICYALKVDTYDRIVATGLAITPSISVENHAVSGSNDFFVARINQDASFDTTFNGVGYNLMQMGTGVDASYAIDITYDNIVVAGYSIEPTTGFRKLSFLTLNAKGIITNSVAMNNLLSSGDNYASAVKFAKDGSIIFGVTARNNNNNSLNVGLLGYVL